MAHHQSEMSDIVVVMDDADGANLDTLVSQLTSAGVTIEDVDRANGVIEGAVASAKLKSIESIPHVKYVRDVFNYEASIDEPGGAEEDRDEHIPR